MTDQIDHHAKAEERLGLATRARANEAAAVVTSGAQVHALLALTDAVRALAPKGDRDWLTSDEGDGSEPEVRDDLRVRVNELLQERQDFIRRIQRGADEIKRLTEQVAEMKASEQVYITSVKARRAEVERLTRERDEARARDADLRSNISSLIRTPTTDADGNALVTVRAGDLARALSSTTYDGPHTDRMYRALDERGEK